MGLPERSVAALARAYSMSEVLSLDDAAVRAQLETTTSTEDALVFRIGGRGIVMDGETLEDTDGCLSELARDLGLAGVDEVRLPASIAPESVEAFIRSLRDGIDQLRQSLEGIPEVSVSFRSVTATESFGPSADFEGGVPDMPEAPEGTEGPPSEVAADPAEAGEGIGSTEFGEAGESAPGTDSDGGAGFAFGPGAVATGEGASSVDESVEPEGEGEPSALTAPPVSEEEAAIEEEGGLEEEPDIEQDAGFEEEVELEEERSPEEPEGRQPPELMPLVDDYLEAASDGREEVAREIREAASEAEEMGAYDRVAEAVEELVLDSEMGSGSPGALALARELYGPDVAGSIVRRLGALRDDLERDRRIRVATTLRGPIADAFAEGLAETDDRGARHAYLDALIELGEDGRAEAKRMLEDSIWWVVRNGATILGGTGTRSDVEDLTAHLAHDHPKVRLQVVRALGRIGGEDAGMLILGMLDDPDPDVRAAGATALGALAPDRAVKSLLERLEIEEEGKVQVQILRALGALGDPGAVPSIEKKAVGTFFSKPSAPVRVAAYRALGSIGTPRAMHLLEEARDDRDDEVRRVVRAILDRRES